MNAAPPPSPGPAPATIDALQRQLGALLADPGHPLLALDALALRGGRVVWAWRTGLRHVGGHGLPPLPVTAGTRWRVASITKLVVTLGVMRLVEDGRLALDDDVSALLGWPLRHPQFPHRAITLRLLLSHRSGLSDGDERYSFDGHTRLQQVLQAGGALYAGGANWRADLAPGTDFEYVNLNFGLVAQVMERATGERFDLLMQRLVLQPLGLRAGFDPAAWPRHQQLDIATLYRKRGTDGEHAAWDPAGPWVPQADDFRLQPAAPPAGLDGHEVGSNGTLFGPQGRLRVSVADLGVVMQMLLDDGRHQGRTFLQPQTVALLAQEHWRRDGGPPPQGEDVGACSWGLGVQRFTDRDDATCSDRLVDGGGLQGWGHTGNAFGLRGLFVLDPQRRTGLVLVLAGPGTDPALHTDPGSALTRSQRRAATAIHRALLAPP
jgi:CubicO group peptidase (beta-lactamase class C family)